MQSHWLKKPELNYSKKVFDIVQFGSSIIEGKEPNDLDVAVIFRAVPVKEQISEAHEIKNQLKKFTNLSVHISSFDLYSLFNEGNFAREGILIYGKSLISGSYFSEKIGFVPKIHISYRLNDKEKKDKVRLNYILNGKGKKYGLLREYGGQIISPGLIEIEPSFEDIFTESVKKVTSNFEVKKLLLHKS